MQTTLGVVILAGGASQRLGPDKPLMKVSGRSMLARTVATALTISRSVIVVAGSRAQEVEYRDEIPRGVVIVHDKTQERGPLFGLCAGLERSNSEYAAVLPCDSPFISKDVILHIYGAAKGVDAAVPAWRDGRIEPLHSVFHVAHTRRATVEALKDDMDTIREMIQQMDRIRFVSVEELRGFDPRLLTFFNVNTLEDLEEARRISSEIGERGRAAITVDRM